MSDVNQLAAFLQQADQPDLDSETTGGTDEALESQEPVNDNDEIVEDQASEAAEDESHDDESDPEDWYTVKVGGEELQVTLDEALKGYQRDVDYRKKTMSVAEERKAVEAEKTRIGELVQQVDSFIKRETETIDWETLQEENPKEYIAKKKELEQAQELKAKAEQEHQQYVNELVQKESKAFLDAMGGEDVWTQEQRSADMKVASEYLASKGFQDNDISQIIDHKLWTVIMDAAKADKYQKTESKVKEEVRRAPKSVKPGQKLPASERKRQQASNRIKAAKNSQEGVAGLADLVRLQRGN